MGGMSYEIKAEVGLLSRNIRIIGADYSDMFSESFGARVIVGIKSDYDDSGDLIPYIGEYKADLILSYLYHRVIGL